MPPIQFTAKNLTISDSTKKFITEKLTKHENFLKTATKLHVLVKQNSSNHDTVRNYRVEISVYMKNAFIKVEEKGDDLKTIINIAEDVLRRRLKRYSEQWTKWDAQKPWEADIIEGEVDEEISTSVNSYLDYQPIIRKKTYADDTPMHPANAVERMELLGHDSFLFKNIESNKYAMLYRRNSGGYGMIEPQS